MVSGFLTSPFDHWRIWSAVASEIDSWSESFTSSTGLLLERRLAASLVFFVGAALGPGQVDPERFGGAERVLVELADLDLFTRFVHDPDDEAERLHLLDEHLEALGDAGLGDVLALDDGLVDLHPAEHVVGLDGEDLLQRVRRAVRLERPH